MVNLDSKIESLQNAIDSLNYWDARVANFECHYLGDEVVLYIRLDDEIAQVCFKRCYKVEYVTALDVEDALKGKEIKALSHFVRDVQEITVKESSLHSSLLDVYLNFTPIEVNIVCRDITIIKRPFAEYHFFWQDNQ